MKTESSTHISEKLSDIEKFSEKQKMAVLDYEQFTSQQKQAIFLYEKLSPLQKINLMEQWEFDEVDREVAGEENMLASEGTPHLLRRIKLVLLRLRDSLHIEESQHRGTTKHGM